MNRTQNQQTQILHALALCAASAALLLVLPLPLHAAWTPESAARCLEAAYPETVRRAEEPGVVLVNGRRVAIGKSMAGRYEQRLDEAGLLDQLEQRYPLDYAAPAPGRNPGMMRNYPFFDAMYGKTPEEVNARLVRASWAPAGQKKLRFTRVNGASRALEAVGREIAAVPALRRYAARPTAAFEYGKAYGSNRKSVHSYGIAIDLELPPAVNEYWRRAGCREGGDCAYPDSLSADPNLKRLVEIFERHGFIWGGKWRLYDAVHFEYRPELFLDECRQ